MHVGDPDARLGRQARVGIPHVHPVALHHQAVQPPGGRPVGPERPLKREEAELRPRVGVDRPRIDDMDAHVVERRGRSAADPARRQAARLVHGEVPGAVEAGGPLHAGQQQPGGHAGWIEAFAQGADRLRRRFGVLDPHGIYVGDQNRRLDQQRPREPDPAAGLERPRVAALVGYGDVGPAPAAGEMGDQGVGEGVDVDHRPLHPRLGQAVEHVVDQRLAADLDQGLGSVVGEGAHPGAEPSGQHHGGPRDRAGHARAPSGTCRSNQALSGRSAGSCRFRSR